MNKPVPTPSDVPDGYEVAEDQAFNSHVGPFFLRTQDEGVHGLFPVRAYHLNRGGVVHGGMLMTFADMIMGRAAHDAIPDRRCATVSLNCDFVASAKLDDWVRGTARVVRRTRAILFVTGELHTDERPILTASGLWKVLG